jgi:hypothetical protein
MPIEHIDPKLREPHTGASTKFTTTKTRELHRAAASGISTSNLNTRSPHSAEIPAIQRHNPLIPSTVGTSRRESEREREREWEMDSRRRMLTSRDEDAEHPRPAAVGSSGGREIEQRACRWVPRRRRRWRVLGGTEGVGVGEWQSCWENWGCRGR